jgi:hypothetical protein
MAPLESAVASLSGNIMATVMELWFARSKKNQTMDQLLQTQVTSAVERRRLERVFESMQDTVTERLMRDAAQRDLPANERNAVLLAVSDSFAAAALTQDDVLAASMNPTAVAEVVRERSHEVRRGAALSSAGGQLYDALLVETASILVTIATSLPEWDSRALAYLLRRQQDLAAAVASAIDALPSSSRPDPYADPLSVYRQSVVSFLDRTETVGFPVSDAASGLRLSETFIPPDVRVGRSRLPLDWALADHRRLLLHGPAGSGKTSILKWLAISSARQSLGGLIGVFNGLLPIYVPLRGAVDAGPPVANADYLVRLAQPSFESKQFAILARQMFESGSALLLFDGLDEIDANSRRVWLRWLAELTERYPNTRFIVTTRTSPFDIEPLIDRQFSTASLEQLDGASKARLIRQWFAATAAPSGEAWSESAPADYAARLTRIIEGNNRLQDLAATPLMCALMCALYRERGDLSLLGADSYADFVDMLVERRDTERGIAGIRRLPKPEALALLGEVARRMVLDGVTELSRQNALVTLAKVAPSLPRLILTPAESLEHLLTRSGLLIEPAMGRVQFVHLTFMEYLAARSFVESDDLSLLASRAHDPAWRSVVVLAASQARPWQGEYLVEKLIARCRNEPNRRVALAAVLQESIAGIVRLRPSLRDECETLLRQEAEKSRLGLTISLSGGEPQELYSLRNWLAEDDEIRESGPIVAATSVKVSGDDALVITGHQPLDIVRLTQSVLRWHRVALSRGQLGVRLEDGVIQITIEPSSL